MHEQLTDKKTPLIGFVGLGRMGQNMVCRLQCAGIQCAAFDPDPQAREVTGQSGAQIAESFDELVGMLPRPRSIWIMVPTAVVGKVLDGMAPLLESGDAIVDGGNSHYVDDIRRATELGSKGLHYLDVGVSGGVWGRDRGYCQMIGGAREAYERLKPVFAALAPGIEGAPRTKGRAGDPIPAEQGYLYCGPRGAGHFVKMVHNGIADGLMRAYAEGMHILRNANAGNNQSKQDAETAPITNPDYFKFDLPLGEIAEVWRRGSVIGSWLLDLTAAALRSDDKLNAYQGHVADSGEGRWTVQAAIEVGVPAPVLSAALYARFASRDQDLYADKLLSAMRQAFGGHEEVDSAASNK